MSPQNRRAGTLYTLEVRGQEGESQMRRSWHIPPYLQRAAAPDPMTP
ncbi:hypothetical protein KZ813_15040 [Sphingomonas sp. RHCKR7]|nr:hypothetical protein [Sphingomonas folli]MBW6528158.1 hypothetical protein [Sphingomonas folli]